MNPRLRRARNSEPTRVMGLDASLNSTGYAYRKAGTGEVVTGHINPGKKRGSNRLWHNLVQLQKILDDAQPEVIYLEGYATRAKGLVFQMGEWGGILRLEAWRRSIKVVTIAPSTLKYMATGSGNAKKPDMMAACEELFSMAIRQDDEADAFLLMRAGEALLSHYGPESFVNRVLEKDRQVKSGISAEPGMAR